MENLKLISEFLTIFNNLLFTTFFSWILIFFFLWVLERRKLMEIVKNVSMYLLIIYVFSLAWNHILKVVL